MSINIILLRNTCTRLAQLSVDLVHNPHEDYWNSLFPAISVYFQTVESVINNCDPQTAEALINDPAIFRTLPFVRRLRTLYEFECERREVIRILSSPDPATATRRYLENHYPCTTIHTASFIERVKKYHKCLVVGSGPLPITGFLLHQQTGLELTFLDKSTLASDLGGKILEASTGRAPRTIAADIIEFENIRDYDMIFLTALVEDNTSKNGQGSKYRILHHLAHRIKVGTLLCLRSPYALGHLLYNAIDPKSLVGFEIQTIPSPCAGRSSLVIATKTRDE